MIELNMADTWILLNKTEPPIANVPREGPGGGLSRECVLRIPNVIVKGD